MNLMQLYATSDKEKFPCAYPEWDKKRIDTTFFSDFYVAWSVSGLKGIRDTYKVAFSNWKTDVKYMVEMTVALNHLLWESYNRMGDCEISREFDKLWRKCHGYCLEAFEGKELEFYTMVLD